MEVINNNSNRGSKVIEAFTLTFLLSSIKTNLINERSAKRHHEMHFKELTMMILFPGQKGLHQPVPGKQRQYQQQNHK